MLSSNWIVIDHLQIRHEFHFKEPVEMCVCMDKAIASGIIPSCGVWCLLPEEVQLLDQPHLAIDDNTIIYLGALWLKNPHVRKEVMPLIACVDNATKLLPRTSERLKKRKRLH